MPDFGVPEAFANSETFEREVAGERATLQQWHLI